MSCMICWMRTRESLTSFRLLFLNLLRFLFSRLRRSIDRKPTARLFSSRKPEELLERLGDCARFRLLWRGDLSSNAVWAASSSRASWCLACKSFRSLLSVIDFSDDTNIRWCAGSVSDMICSSYPIALEDSLRSCYDCCFSDLAKA